MQKKLSPQKRLPGRSADGKICVRMGFRDFFFPTFQNELSCICPRARHSALKSRLWRSGCTLSAAFGQPANFFFLPKNASPAGEPFLGQGILRPAHVTGHGRSNMRELCIPWPEERQTRAEEPSRAQNENPLNVFSYHWRKGIACLIRSIDFLEYASSELG